MGMNYNVTFHNAFIPPEKYNKLLGRSPEDPVMSLKEVVELALEKVSTTLGGYEVIVGDEDGIDISGCGFYDSASYSYKNDLIHLLSVCNVGAYIHEVDVEEGSGYQWRHYVKPGGGIETVLPTITWPEPDFLTQPATDGEEKVDR